MMLEFDEAEEVGGELVVAGSDAAPLFEAGEEALDAPALPVGDAVIAVLIRAVAAGRDDRLAALFVDQVVEAVGIIGAVGEHLACRQSADQVAGRCHVVLLTRPEHEAHRQAERIDYGMDLGAEPSTRAPESLGRSSPLFTRAPAA